MTRLFQSVPNGRFRGPLVGWERSTAGLPTGRHVGCRRIAVLTTTEEEKVQSVSADLTDLNKKIFILLSFNFLFNHESPNDTNKNSFVLSCYSWFSSLVFPSCSGAPRPTLHGSRSSLATLINIKHLRQLRR